MGILFSKFKPFCPAFGLEWKFLGRRPKPALLFFIAKKVSKKASTPGSHKIYFYPGILQLPTVGQVKCLYNSVKNKFYKRLQRGALNGNNTTNGEQQQRQTAKRQRQKHQRYIFSIQNSAGVVLNTIPPREHKNLYVIGTPPTRLISFFYGRIIC